MWLFIHMVKTVGGSPMARTSCCRRDDTEYHFLLQAPVALACMQHCRDFAVGVSCLG